MVNGIINGLVGILSSIIVDIADGFLASPISGLINSLIADLLPDSISVPVANTTLNLGFFFAGVCHLNGGFDLVLSAASALPQPILLCCHRWDRSMQPVVRPALPRPRVTARVWT